MPPVPESQVHAPGRCPHAFDESAMSIAGLASKNPQGRRAKPLRWTGETGKSSGRTMWLVPTVYQMTMSWRSSTRFAAMNEGMPSPPVVREGYAPAADSSSGASRVTQSCFVANSARVLRRFAGRGRPPLRDGDGVAVPRLVASIASGLAGRRRESPATFSIWAAAELSSGVRPQSAGALVEGTVSGSLGGCLCVAERDGDEGVGAVTQHWEAAGIAQRGGERGREPVRIDLACRSRE